MKSEPYARFKTDELILRDYLAVDRTVLANERTLLSYVRTAIAFAAAGAALIHFFDFVFVKLVGWVLIPLAIGILGVGAQRYLRMRQRLAKLVDKAPTEDVP
jgi:putative membrane protein